MAGPVIPERYRAALGDDDPFLAMFDAPQRLRTLLKGLTETQLSRRPAPGKWSIKEIVAHLADGEVILGSRYRLVAAHDRPAIAAKSSRATTRATSGETSDHVRTLVTRAKDVRVSFMVVGGVSRCPMPSSASPRP